jgi:hemerythrin-like domain-containing protein
MEDDFKFAISRSLHDDHMAVSALLDSLENLLAKGGRGMPDLDNDEARDVLSRLATVIPQEVHVHFAFEEEIFVRLDEEGETEIGETLTKEHRVILPVADRVAATSARTLEHGMTEPEWEEFRSDAAELIERLQAHILIEEKALLAIIEDTLTAEDDLVFSERYAAMAA